MFKVRYGQVLFETRLGDITCEEADALVNPANSLLTMGGGVALALKTAGGEEVEEEALKKAPIPVGKAVATAAGKLKAKYIIHSPTMPEPAARTDVSSVNKATKAALALARLLGLRSLVFPGMGTGVGRVPYEKAASAMVKALKEHINEGTCLQRVILISLKKDLLDAFDRALASELR